MLCKGGRTIRGWVTLTSMLMVAAVGFNSDCSVVSFSDLHLRYLPRSAVAGREGLRAD